MFKLIGLVLVIVGFLLGLPLAGVVHEVGRVLVTLILRLIVDWMQAMRSSSGPAATFCDACAHYEYIIAGLAATFCTTTAGLVAAVTTQWYRLKPRLALFWAALLFPFAIDPWPLILTPSARYGDTGYLNPYIEPRIVAVLGTAWCLACIWGWWSHTGFGARLVGLLRGTSNPARRPGFRNRSPVGR